MKKPMNSETLLDIVFTKIAKISSVRSANKILELLAQLGEELTDADRCTVWVYNSKDAELWTKVAHGIDNTITISVESGIVGYVIRENKEIIENDVPSSAYFNDKIDKESGYHTRNMMVVPMINYDNEIIGAYQVINKNNDQDFSKDDLRYIKLASMYAAETIQSILLLEEIDSNQKEIIFRLSEAVEMKSKETGNHIKRVAKYSRILAEAYGLNENEADIVEFASPMHDIGKIAISDAILNKPDKLDEFEFSVMQTHTTLGYNLLHSSDRKFLKAASIISHQHHEKYNGSGYPQGLKGEAIHIYGRIVALADVFDALSMSRVYKPAWDIERITKLIHEEKGEHFDPQLVDMFFDNIDKFLEIRDKYHDSF